MWSVTLPELCLESALYLDARHKCTVSPSKGPPALIPRYFIMVAGGQESVPESEGETNVHATFPPFFCLRQMGLGVVAPGQGQLAVEMGKKSCTEVS